MKKIVISVIMLIFTVSVSATAAFAGVNINTMVPQTHTITVNYDEHGAVNINGNYAPDGSRVTVDRNSKAVIAITPNDGYKAYSVTANGVDITSTLSGNTIIIESVTDDAVITITFAQADSFSGSGGKSGSHSKGNNNSTDSNSGKDTKTTSPSTGYENQFIMPIAILSAGLALLCAVSKKEPIE